MPYIHILTGTAVGTCTLEFVIAAGIATGMVCPLGRCNSSGKGPGTGLRKQMEKEKHLWDKVHCIFHSSLALCILLICLFKDGIHR